MPFNFTIDIVLYGVVVLGLVPDFSGSTTTGATVLSMIPVAGRSPSIAFAATASTPKRPAQKPRPVRIAATATSA